MIYLLVERLEVSYADPDSGIPEFADVIETGCEEIKNSAPVALGKSRELKCFEEIVKLLKKHLRIVTSLSGTPIGPPMDKDKFLNLKNLLDVKARGLNLVKIKDEYQLCKIETKFKFCVLEKGCPTVTSAEIACIRPEDDKNKMITGEEAQTIQFKTEDKKKINITFYLRSLQGMLYFAGELIRPEYKDQIIVDKKGKGECEGLKRLPLFTVEEGQPGDAGVVVDHRNTTYWIPADDNCSRSMQTLAFLSQILGLYQSRANIAVSVPQQTINR